MRVASRQAQGEAQARADAILSAFGIAAGGTVSGAAHGGAFVPSPSGPELKTFNPASGEVLASISTAGLDDLAAASEATQEAFLRWRMVPAPRRGEIVRRLGDAFRERKEDLARLISLENGKILGEARGEVQEVIDICDFAVGLSRQLYGNQMHSERPGHRLTEQWHPLGVVGIVSAFNFPVAVPGWGWALALVCGDAVLWKPSHLTPLISVAAQQSSRGHRRDRAEGVFGLAIGSGGTVGEALLADPRLPLIPATGSCDLGERVSSALAKRVRALDPRAGRKQRRHRPRRRRPRPRAARRPLRRRRNGRPALHQHPPADPPEGIADTFLERLVKAYRTVRIGDPLDDSTLMGPLIYGGGGGGLRRASRPRSEQGGDLLCGGEARGRQAGLLRPADDLRLALGDADRRGGDLRADPPRHDVSDLEEAIAVQQRRAAGPLRGLFTTDLR